MPDDGASTRSSEIQNGIAMVHTGQNCDLDKECFFKRERSADPSIYLVRDYR